MGTRGHQRVITKKGELKLSQYNQWDSYPSGQGLQILNYFRTGDLKKYQDNLNNLSQITIEEVAIVDADKDWKINYPYLSRDCGANIHQMIEDGEVKFVQFMDDEWCEGFYTIDFHENKFIAKFHDVTREYPLNDLPSDEEFINQMERVVI
jgi:hypothetical protein